MLAHCNTSDPVVNGALAGLASKCFIIHRVNI